MAIRNDKWTQLFLFICLVSSVTVTFNNLSTSSSFSSSSSSLPPPSNSSLPANWPLSTSHSASNTAYTLRNTLFLATFFVNSSPTPNLSSAKLRDTINFRRLMNTHLHFGTKLKEESFECNVYVFQVKQLAHLLFLFLFLPENKWNFTTKRII